MQKYHIYIDREDLTITYSDPTTMETIKVLRFKTLNDLEKYLYSR